MVSIFSIFGNEFVAMLVFKRHNQMKGLKELSKFPCFIDRSLNFDFLPFAVFLGVANIYNVLYPL